MLFWYVYAFGIFPCTLNHLHQCFHSSPVYGLSEMVYFLHIHTVYAMALIFKQLNIYGYADFCNDINYFILTGL